MRTKIFLLLLLVTQWVVAQTDTTFTAVDSADVDTTEVAGPANELKNARALRLFYQKLATLEKEKSGKINIVHIGDSHIQADLMTHVSRRSLQALFGNAGRGFVFPHRLAGTNGSSDYKISSNARWSSYRNISTPNGSPVGLSGIVLSTSARDFVMELDVKTSENAFTSLKIITPQNRDLFTVATAKRTITLESEVPKKITHRIKNGESLSVIADKYNASVSAIKKANGMKSDRIRAGKTLRIPTNQMEQKRVERSEFLPLELQADAVSHFYVSPTPLDKIYLLPSEAASDIALNGMVLENGDSGILYHSIGVNGAKFSDYNKYPEFFTQLQALSPDLVLLSLGTNESFDKMSGPDYMIQLESFLQQLKQANPGAEVLVITPPPSLFKRRYPNTFAADYAQRIVDAVQSGAQFAAWDMYSQLGGLYGVGRLARKGFIGGDRVHYSHLGYQKQGDLLTEVILKGFEDFKAEAK